MEESKWNTQVDLINSHKGGKGGTEDGTNRKQLAKRRPISNYINKYINLSWINTLQLKAQNY